MEHANFGLSSASIRNTMNALETAGYLDHPHTSAGRIPTDLGYRAYVDELMERSGLPQVQQSHLRAELDQVRGDIDSLLRETSRLLGELTHLLGVVLSPRLATGILERLDAVPLSSERLMFVVAVRGGLVKTIVAEFEVTSIRRDDIERIVTALNERLVGLTLEEIRRTAAERTSDLDFADRTGIVRLVLHRAATLFADLPEGRMAEKGGVARLVAQPEFNEPQDVLQVLELLENDDVVVHLFDMNDFMWEPGRAVVLIGQETADETPDLGGRYSIVKAPYRLGETVGSLGVIGPRRMDYAQAIALVEGVAALLSNASPEVPTLYP